MPDTAPERSTNLIWIDLEMTGLCTQTDTIIEIATIVTDKYLITTDSWFFAPDGNHYKSAWGNVIILGDDMLGIKTNARSANWYAQIGDNKRGVIIAGCQIHYAVRCPEKPNVKDVEVEESYEGKIVLNTTKTRIYIAE